ncbi:ArsC family protein [Alteromonadaceae bacterium Bs31]|nr:ArsC family protein [Alteromonadaceae bacterium Bs31]
MTLTLYGIKNCDSVKKARKWLDKHNLAYVFHDFRDHGLDQKTLSSWLTTLGVEQVINKRSTTWKQLDDIDKQKVLAGKALAITLANPTLIKRPVLDTGETLLVGFSEENYSQLT